EIGDRDPKGAENYFAEKNEADRHRQARDQPQRALVLPTLRVRMTAEPEKNRDQSDRVDRDEERDEGEQKFFEVRLHLAVAASRCEAQCSIVEESLALINTSGNIERSFDFAQDDS